MIDIGNVKCELCLQMSASSASSLNGGLSCTSASGDWWLHSPYYSYYSYYQPFIIYPPSKDRSLPREEVHQMSDEEFDAAFSDLFFGNE